MYIPEISLELKHVEKQLTMSDALSLKKGSVILVRSDYAHEKYLDHASLITGGFIKKDRGLRPNLITLPNIIMNISKILDAYKPVENKTILLLDEFAATWIMDVLGMHLSTGELLTVKL